MEQMYEQISDAIGTTNYRAILNGKELHLQETPSHTTLAELGLVDSCNLMIQKRDISDDTVPRFRPSEKINAFESRIQEYFHDLFDMLELPAPQGDLVIPASLPQNLDFAN